MIANNAETHILQRAFRNIMNALARPGRLGEVEVLRAGAEEENPLPAHFEVVVKTLRFPERVSKKQPSGWSLIPIRIPLNWSRQILF